VQCLRVLTVHENHGAEEGILYEVLILKGNPVFSTYSVYTVPWLTLCSPRKPYYAILQKTLLPKHWPFPRAVTAMEFFTVPTAGACSAGWQAGSPLPGTSTPATVDGNRVSQQDFVQYAERVLHAPVIEADHDLILGRARWHNGNVIR